MRIGEIARAARTGADTVRFYERSGLLPKPGRTRSGYRRYSPDAVLRLRFIVHAKALGFSLREIKELLALRVTPGKSCADVRELATQRIDEIDRRIAALLRVRQALETISASCTGAGPVSDCPIVEALEKERWNNEG